MCGPPMRAAGTTEWGTADGDAKPTLPILKWTHLDAFWRAHPEYVLGPILLALAMRASWLVPTVAQFYEGAGIQPLGLSTAAHYTAFTLMLSFAVHGFILCYAAEINPVEHKVQTAKAVVSNPAPVATRSSAAILTELAYVALPVRPASTSWFHFFGTLIALALLWDAIFFALHATMHKVPALYKAFHKTHHTIKDPNVFVAYFVAYQSHLVLEQAIIIGSCIAFLPRDVLLFTLYSGALGTFLQHSGFELGHLRVPLTPVTIGHLLSVMSWYAPLFGEQTATHHDWHHEKFVGNYALSFTYLDRIFGTLHQGRAKHKES